MKEPGAEVAKPLSLEDVEAAVKRIRDAPSPRVCGSREVPHVFHPTACRRGGWAYCANCGALLFLLGD